MNNTPKFKASSLASTATEDDTFAYIQTFIKERYNKEVASIDELKKLESLTSFRGGLEIGHTYKVKRGLRRDAFLKDTVPVLYIPLEGGKEVSLTALTDTRNGADNVTLEFLNGESKKSRKETAKRAFIPEGIQSISESELLETLVKDPESLEITYYGWSWFPWVAKTNGEDSKEKWLKGYRRASKRHHCIVKRATK